MRNDIGKLCQSTPDGKNFDLMCRDILPVYFQFPETRNISYTICFPYGKTPYSRRLSGMIAAMSDILADYREWADEHLQQHVSTHSDRCHMWHEWCMIHRLAAELEKSRKYRDLLEADLSIAMLAATRNGNLSACETVRLTDKEREVELLRAAIRRLAEQDATLSVCDGNVTVTVDATLTDAEREAIRLALRMAGDPSPVTAPHLFGYAATLRGLLERLGGGA